MSGAIWLIVEGPTDEEILRTLIKRKYPYVHIHISRPPGKNPNLSLLARYVEILIQQIIDNRKRKRVDCIAVLHDVDLYVRLNDRKDYEKIATICKKYKKQVKHITAADEIESWLLSDAVMSKRLGIPHKSWDNEKQPSKALSTYLDEATPPLPKYRVENLNRILIHMGDNNLSPSFQAALKHLENAPCTKL